MATTSRRVAHRRLSKHVETGKPLPSEMLKAMIAAQNVGEGLAMLRQLYLSTLDLEIHGA
jgi:Zn-dependent oligopeptidase